MLPERLPNCSRILKSTPRPPKTNALHPHPGAVSKVLPGTAPKYLGSKVQGLDQKGLASICSPMVPRMPDNLLPDGPQNAPIYSPMVPRRPPFTPRWSPEGPHLLPDGHQMVPIYSPMVSRMPQFTPRWSPECSNLLPDGPQKASIYSPTVARRPQFTPRRSP